MFFLGSLQLLFMGIIGEYIGNIHTQVHNRPLVVERERLNFQHEPGEPLARRTLASGAAAGR
jgi:cell division protein FtsL